MTTTQTIPQITATRRPAPAGTEYSIDGKSYPVTEFINYEGTELPLVDIPAMSDYRWQELALKSRLENPELYRLTEDVEAAIAYLRQWLKDNRDKAE